MPTVLRVDGYEILIYLHDHLPPHVHVIVRGNEVIVNLNCEGGDPELRDVFRASARETRKAKEIVLEKSREPLRDVEGYPWLNSTRSTKLH